jgi:hypothetical protein
VPARPAQVENQSRPKDVWSLFWLTCSAGIILQ